MLLTFYQKVDGLLLLLHKCEFKCAGLVGVTILSRHVDRGIERFKPATHA